MFETVMPRSAGGGSLVIVAKRPPLRTACNAGFAPLRAALMAAETPSPPVSLRASVGHSAP
jgi:hypothetical protein